MGTKKFSIKTFKSFGSAVVEFEKKIYNSFGDAFKLAQNKEDSSLWGFNTFNIDIHEIVETDEIKRPIREITDKISVELIPDWVNKISFDESIKNILNKCEVANEFLAIAIRLVCPRINYVIESEIISLNDISKRKPILFKDIYLNDITGKIEVQSELIRTKNSNPTDPQIAFSELTILSRNRNIMIFIDEVDEVGGNSLPITPGDTGEKMFMLKNINPLGVEPPTLIYHKQFKDFFNNGDNYNTVQCIMINIGLPYCEQLLKWIIFGKPNIQKVEHQGIFKFIGNLCDSREKELEEIINEADINKKIQTYLILSNLIFENVQGMGKSWKRMLYQIIENEKK